MSIFSGAGSFLGGHGRNLLLAQQAHQAEAAQAQSRLASGLKVETALDGPAAFFDAKGLEGRASALESLMDGIGAGRRALEAADQAASGIGRLLDEIDALIAEAEAGAGAPDATSQILLDAAGLTDATDVRTLGFDAGADNYTFVSADGQPASLHRFARDGWTVGDLMTTINGSANGVTASLDGSGRLVLTADAGGTVDIQSGQTTLQTGLEGRIYNAASDIPNIPAAEAFAASNPTFATFTATTLDYPQGVVSAVGDLANFLGADAASLSDPALGSTAMQNMVFVIEGYLDVPAGASHSFAVRSDDGFRLQVNGNTEIEFLNPRGPGTTSTAGAGVTLTEGLHHIRLTYWERGGGEALEVTSSLMGGGFLGGSVLQSAPDPVYVPGGSASLDTARLDTLLDQIDGLAGDADVLGVNAALGDALDVLLDERGVELGTRFGAIDSAGLGLRGANTSDLTELREALSAARTELEVHAVHRSSSADILESREAFNARVIETLLAGRDTLTLADPNEESARMLAAQTRSDLASTVIAGLRGTRDPIFNLFG
ncbi:MAG: PA14 domain-containing protein [Pseudomonadota bacterium]